MESCSSGSSCDGGCRDKKLMETVKEAILMGSATVVTTIMVSVLVLSGKGCGTVCNGGGNLRGNVKVAGVDFKGIKLRLQ